MRYEIFFGPSLLHSKDNGSKKVLQLLIRSVLSPAGHLTPSAISSPVGPRNSGRLRCRVPRAANGAGKRAEKGGLQARSPKKVEAEGALPMKRLALPLVLLMSLALFGVLTASAQTTTTYTLTTPLPTFNIPPYNGTTMQGYPEGRENFYPFRAFDIP